MAICVIDDATIGNLYGNFYIEPIGSVLAVNVYDQIRVDLAGRFPSAEIFFAQCRYRLYTRITNLSELDIQVFGGVPARYKLGRVTFEKAGHSILGEEYITYIQQQYNIKYVLVTEIVGATNIIYEECPTPDTERLIVGIAPSFNFVADYQLADTFILDPASGVQLEAYVQYTGFYNAEFSPPPGFGVTYLDF